MWRRIAWAVVLVAGGLGGLAQAQTDVGYPFGTLQSCAATCVTGPQANGQSGATGYNYFVGDNLAAVTVRMTATATIAGFTVEQSIDKGTTWTAIGNAVASATTTLQTFQNPVGWYRTNVATTCTGCTFTSQIRGVTGGMRGM